MSARACECNCIGVARVWCGVCRRFNWGRCFRNDCVFKILTMAIFSCWYGRALAVGRRRALLYANFARWARCPQ